MGRWWWSAMAVAVAACSSGGSGADRSAAQPTSLTAVGPTTAASSTSIDDISAASTTGGSTYVVQAGDALFLIAGEHCVSADEIVAVNGWSEGLDHALYPGDQIDLPDDACTPTSVAGGSNDATTEGATDDDRARRLDLILNIYNSDLGNNAGMYSDQTCSDAWDAVLEFERGAGSAARARAALASLSIPADATAFTDAWEQFKLHHEQQVLDIIDTEVREGRSIALQHPAIDEVAAALAAAHAAGPTGLSLVGDACEQYQLDESDPNERFAEPAGRLHEIRFYFDPMSGTNAGEFSDPSCVTAYAAGFDFEMGVGSKADVLAALAVLTATLPSRVTAYIDAMDTFLDEHGVDAARIIATYERDGEVAALADPALDEVAFALRDGVFALGRRRVSEFVNTTCSSFQL